MTISRSDSDALIDAAENAEDIASVRAWKAYATSVGCDAAIANSYTGAEAERLLDGEIPVRIWREKRGMTQRALAVETAIPTGYLSEIESRRKPGSVAATANWQRRSPCRWRTLLRDRTISAPDGLTEKVTIAQQSNSYDKAYEEPLRQPYDRCASSSFMLIYRLC